MQSNSCDLELKWLVDAVKLDKYGMEPEAPGTFPIPMSTVHCKYRFSQTRKPSGVPPAELENAHLGVAIQSRHCDRRERRSSSWKSTAGWHGDYFSPCDLAGHGRATLIWGENPPPQHTCRCTGPKWVRTRPRWSQTSSGVWPASLARARPQTDFSAGALLLWSGQCGSEREKTCKTFLDRWGVLGRGECTPARTPVSPSLPGTRSHILQKLTCPTKSRIIRQEGCHGLNIHHPIIWSEQPLHRGTNIWNDLFLYNQSEKLC